MALVLTWAGSVLAETAPSAIDFNRQIRPLLSENCFACHGPDQPARKAELRLDVKEGWFRERKGKMPIVAGNPDASEVLRRIDSHDPDELMPPPATEKKLTPAQRAIIRTWIEQGAKWEQHWSFVPPRMPALPAVNNAAWARNPIDLFIAARLEKEGLRPSPEADKPTLVRRLYLDLTGLPPTPREVDRFLLDNRPDAYERLVDGLLASPQHGERMALQWLDAARYADTHGYHIDSARDMTRWREWVINAYITNKPFDAFTTEQLAGDMLPKATIEQKIASGFQRNHMINFEGGAIPEEYHHAYLIDRVNTTGSVWLGLTVGCAQCHDHKYDPFTAKDYYSLYAFFNNVPENGLDGKQGNAIPVLKLPSAEQKEKLEQIGAEVQQLESQLAQAAPQTDAAQEKWEQALAPMEWNVIEPSEVSSEGGATFGVRPDQSLLVSGKNPASETYRLIIRPGARTVRAIRLEALPDDSFTAKGPGRSENGNFVLTDVELRLLASETAQDAPPLEIKSASADYSQNDFPISAAIDDKPGTGWAIFPETGKPHQAVFELKEPRQLKESEELFLTLRFQSNYAQHQIGRLRISLTDSARVQTAGDLPKDIRAALDVPAGRRDEAQLAEIRKYYRSQVDTGTRPQFEKLETLKKSRQEIERKVQTTMVMAEMDKPRDTFVMMRGAYDQKGQKVSAATPSFLPPLPKGAPTNRLGLAQWLLDDGHPLTARVAVNRYWQMFFGTGIVKTSEDFGSQGELPTHPELLDYLALRFSRGSDGSDGTPSVRRWDTRALLRLIVTSSAYRQSSAVPPQLVAKDPENRLLARGPRFRLQAEFIRDQALAVSGLINLRIGGESVSPYQPAGLWEELMSRGDGEQFTAQTYDQSHGPDLYRRTMYTFWKRTCPPAQLSTFDAPDRETCTVRRAITNTPLQALILLNDPTYVEASRKLAERMMTEVSTGPDDRIAFAFRLATARPPSANETAILRELFERQLAEYRGDSKASLKLLTNGESPHDTKLDQAELAAWTIVASTILNLDETVTKG